MIVTYWRVSGGYRHWFWEKNPARLNATEFGSESVWIVPGTIDPND